MDREEYIESLIEQGYSDEQIESMLEEKFPDPFALPKKQTDPVKSETSVGSLKSTVFKQENGSSELSESEATTLTPFTGTWIEDKDEFNKIGKDLGYWNGTLNRVTKVEYNEKESQGLKLIESIDRGEGELGKELFSRYEKAKEEVEREFEDKDKVNTLIMSPGFSMGGSMVGNTYKSKTKKGKEVYDYIDKAKRELSKKISSPSEEEIIERAKQLSLQDKKYKQREKVLTDLVKDMEGDADVSRLAKKFLGNAMTIQLFSDATLDWQTKKGERAEFTDALKSARRKNEKYIKDQEAKLNDELRSHYQSGWEIQSIEKKYGKDTANWPQEVLSSYTKELKNYYNTYQDIKQDFSDLQVSSENLGTFEQEIDLAKREYDFFNNTATKLSSAVSSMVGGGLGAIELGIDIGVDVIKNVIPLDIDTKEDTIFNEIASELISGAEQQASTVRKDLSTSDIESVEDFFTWSGDLLVTQSPQLALNAATGGSWSGLAVMGAIAGGQKYIETLDDESLAQWQRYTASVGVGIAETLSEKVTNNIFLRNFPGLRAARAATKGATDAELATFKEFFQNGFKSGVKRSGQAFKAIGKDFNEEGISELAAQVAGNALDIAVLGKEEVGLLDGVQEAYLSGAVIGGIISTAPNIGGKIIAPFVNNPNKLLQKNMQKMEELINQGYNAKDVRTQRAIQKELKKLQYEQSKIVLGGLQTLYGLSSSDIKEGHRLYSELQELVKDREAIVNDEGLTNEQKKSQLETIETRFNEVQQQRSAIIEKGNKALEKAYQYEKKISAVKNIVSGLGDIEFIVAENSKEAKELAEKYRQDDSEVAVEEDGYIIRNTETGQQRIIINEQVALQNERVNVAGHELLHGVLFATVRNNLNSVKGLEQALREEINKIDKSLLEKGELKDRLDQYTDKAKPEETLTLFFDAVAEGKIKLNESKADKIGGEIRRVVQNIPGFSNINFETSKDVLNFIKDFNTSVERGKLTRAQKKLAKEGAKGTIVDVKPETKEATLTPETEDLAVAASKSAKATVLEEINNLIPESIETKEQFLSDRSFTKVYESAMNPGGAINNYIKSRTSSAMEAELAVDSVLERLMNFDPQAIRKDGSTIGREGFGEFIFANTAFGKLDAKKKLFQESERRSKETSIDDSVKEIADVETVEETEVQVKEKPTINPLKFTGVPSDIKLSDEPGKGLTFKKVAKQYAGEVGEQAIGIPAKKITESAANLGSVNEARAIQQFFFKADNLDKFVKILPEYNIAIPETKIGLETLDVPKDVSGTGLGLPKRILDYFYEDFIDPTGKLTSPKGRSKGLTSQTAVKRLKPEFRGTVSKETIDKIKKDIGITPKGELNILPKGELRSPIGQLLKGMAKTYSSLAANTLVRQEMTKAAASKEDIARVAGGKQEVMASRSAKKPSKVTETTEKVFKEIIAIDTKTKLDGSAARNDVVDKLMPNSRIVGLKDQISYMKSLVEDFNGNLGLPTFMLKDSGNLQTGTRDYSKKGIFFVASVVNKKDPERTKQNIEAVERGELIDAEEVLKSEANQKEDINPLTNKPYTDQEVKDLKAFTRGKGDANIGKNIADKESIDRGRDLFHNIVSYKLQRNPELAQMYGEILYNANLNSNIGRNSATSLGKEPGLEKGRKTEEHTYQANNYATRTLQFAAKGGKALEGWNEWTKNNYYQITVAKGVKKLGESDNTDQYLNYTYKIDGNKYASKSQEHPAIREALDEALETGDFSKVPDSSIRMFEPKLQEIVTENTGGVTLNANTTTFKDGTFAAEYNVEIPSKYNSNIDILIEQNKIIYEVAAKKIDKATAKKRMDNVLKVYENSANVLKSNEKKAPSVIVSASKSNKKLLNNLNNYDKALRNARNTKAPVKGISVFDFDDTLATTNSMVGVTMPDGTKTKIDATEFAKRGDDLLKQGAEFDFSDFSKVVDGKPGPLITKLEKALKKFGNKDLFVLTARPANSASAIYEFLKGLGFEIPLENITGLANSSPEAKAQWMVNKAAEGYNDFYFTDDAYKNVKAVQDAMSVLDVKSKERIVYKDIHDKMDKEFNDILEAKSGIASEKTYSKAKAEVVGSSQGKFKWFIPPSADDFVGLLYNTLAKGKLGDAQMAWYKKNLLDPYARAMNAISSERVSLAADYKALKKRLGIVPKNLRKKIKGEGFTKEQAVRMYIWNKQGMDVPGLSESDLADMVKYVESDASLQVFADQLIEINKGDGYPGPKDYWLAGSITTDLMDGLGGTKRAKHLEEWQQNVDTIFSEKNLNKLEAIHGKAYREALENMLQRMKSGKNRNYAGDSTTGRMMDWLNGSIGAIMFLNTRSAVLQTLSAVNFINFKDNNILAAGKAFANQPQYWKDFKELFNSDFLKERRDNATININESDIADMARKGGAKGAISYLLQKGFTPTQIADSFAIAAGGATFYRNRIKTYMKAGMTEAQAKEKAFLDFRETAEESQQSSRPDRISKQQAGPLGRVVLAFANTPSQYARIIKKASQDLMAGRGDAKTNISKILYYGAVQGFIFNAIQQALFAADLDDEDEKTEKMIRLGNGMADGVLRGMGVSGAAVTVVKNAGLRVYNESQKDRPKYEKVAFELTKLSPPIASKLSRINQAAREVQWNSDEMKQKGFSLDNPAWLAAGNVISATTNVPLDRVIKKVNNVNDALSQDLEMQERIALLAGWQSWELGLDKKKKKQLESGEIKFEDIQLEDIQFEDIKLED